MLFRITVSIISLDWIALSYHVMRLSAFPQSGTVIGYGLVWQVAIGNVALQRPFQNRKDGKSYL